MTGAEREGISLEELALAARNHSMPYEALRYDVTPVGLHYLLIHYDIPDVDPSTFRLSVGGHVRTPLELSLDALRAIRSSGRDTLAAIEAREREAWALPRAAAAIAPASSGGRSGRMRASTPARAALSTTAPPMQ